MSADLKDDLPGIKPVLGVPRSIANVPAIGQVDDRLLQLKSKSKFLIEIKISNLETYSKQKSVYEITEPGKV